MSEADPIRAWTSYCKHSKHAVEMKQKFEQEIATLGNPPNIYQVKLDITPRGYDSENAYFIPDCEWIEADGPIEDMESTNGWNPVLVPRDQREKQAPTGRMDGVGMMNTVRETHRFADASIASSSSIRPSMMQTQHPTFQAPGQGYQTQQTVCQTPIPPPAPRKRTAPVFEDSPKAKAAPEKRQRLAFTP